VSAQIGERLLDPTVDDDEDPAWRWGNSDQWYANEIRWDQVRLRELACISQRVAKRAGARGREDKARADSGAQAY